MYIKYLSIEHLIQSMINFTRKNMNSGKYNVNKGGLAGAFIGILASLGFYKKTDTPTKKAMKTGMFGLFGLLVGTLIEKRINRNNK